MCVTVLWKMKEPFDQWVAAASCGHHTTRGRHQQSQEVLLATIDGDVNQFVPLTFPLIMSVKLSSFQSQFYFFQIILECLRTCQLYSDQLEEITALCLCVYGCVLWQHQFDSAPYVSHTYIMPARGNTHSTNPRAMMRKQKRAKRRRVGRGRRWWGGVGGEEVWGGWGGGKEC